MNLIFDNPFDNIIVCGDIHGEMKELVFKLTNQYRITNSLIIIAGDVGLGFHKDGHTLDLFAKMNPKLKKCNNTILLLRGNHDNKAYWNDNPVFKQYWQDGTENVRLLKDYTLIQASTDRLSAKILCVGGAISIDRQDRTLNKNYWLDEIFVYDEDKAKEFEGVTHVITHSAPDFCEPLSKYGIREWIRNDNALSVDCEKERTDHTLLYNKLSEKNKITKWYYGHFHHNHLTENNNTQFKMLGIMTLCEL